MTRARHRRNRRSLARLLTALVALAALAALAGAACSGGDDGSSPADEPSAPSNSNSSDEEIALPDSVTIGISGSEWGNYPPHDIARGMGAFDQLSESTGVSISFVAFDTGPTAIAALASGEVDYLLSTGATTLQAAAGGQAVVDIFALTQGTQLVLVAPDELEDRGTGVEALEAFDGDNWGLLSVGGSVEALTRATAEFAGLEWDAQNQIAPGSLAATAASISEGRIDIAALDAPTAVRLVDAGDAYVVLSMGADEDLQREAFSGFSIATTLVTRSDVLAEYRDFSRLVVEAELSGLRRAHELVDDAATAYDLYPQSFQETVPLNLFEQIWEIWSTGFHDSGFMPADEVEVVIDYQRELGAFDAAAEIPESTFDDSLVHEAYESLGIEPPG